MCGITGLVAFQRDLTDERHQTMLQAMTDSLRLRGPDGEGIWTASHAGFGHRRLAIIDLEAGPATELMSSLVVIQPSSMPECADARDSLGW